MGTLNFTVGSYARDGNKNIADSAYRTSGAHTTSVTASFAEDAGGDIELRAGEVFMATASVAMWVRFGGGAAAVGAGHYLPAEASREFEVGPGTAGKVSAIDA